MGSDQRQKKLVISVRVSPKEHSHLLDYAESCSLPPSTYLRQIGLGHVPKTTQDQQLIHHLALLNTDLNRVGGLLKMWLSNEERAGFAKNLDVVGAMANLKSVAAQIEDVVVSL